MEIRKNIENDKVELSIIGRLDTMTAPQLEEEINESVGECTKELVLDLKDLEYISSAGLRVLLGCQKMMNKQGSMKIKNVSSEVMEIFDVTGFSDILTIE